MSCTAKSAVSGTCPVLLGHSHTPPHCLLHSMCAALLPCTVPSRSLAAHLHLELCSFSCPFPSCHFTALHGRKSTKRRKENFEHELHLLPGVRCPCRMRHSSARTALRHLSICYFPTSSLGHLATLPGITPLAPLQPYGQRLCACHRLFPTIVSTLSRPGTLLSSPEQCLTRCGPPNDPIVTVPVLLGMI